MAGNGTICDVPGPIDNSDGSHTTACRRVQYNTTCAFHCSPAHVANGELSCTSAGWVYPACEGVARTASKTTLLVFIAVGLLVAIAMCYWLAYCFDRIVEKNKSEEDPSQRPSARQEDRRTPTEPSSAPLLELTALKPPLGGAPEPISAAPQSMPSKSTKRSNAVSPAPASTHEGERPLTVSSADEDDLPPGESLVFFSSLPPGAKLAKALYPFYGAAEGNLTFAKDDTIFIVEVINEHWYVGQLGEKTGTLPAKYVKFIDQMDDLAVEAGPVGVPSTMQGASSPEAMKTSAVGPSSGDARNENSREINENSREINENSREINENAREINENSRENEIRNKATRKEVKGLLADVTVLSAEMRATCESIKQSEDAITKALHTDEEARQRFKDEILQNPPSTSAGALHSDDAMHASVVAELEDIKRRVSKLGALESTLGRLSADHESVQQKLSALQNDVAGFSSVAEPVGKALAELRSSQEAIIEAAKTSEQLAGKRLDDLRLDLDEKIRLLEGKVVAEGCAAPAVLSPPGTDSQHLEQLRALERTVTQHAAGHEEALKALSEEFRAKLTKQISDHREDSASLLAKLQRHEAEIAALRSLAKEGDRLRGQLARHEADSVLIGTMSEEIRQLKQDQHRLEAASTDKTSALPPLNAGPLYYKDFDNVVPKTKKGHKVSRRRQ